MNKQQIKKMKIDLLKKGFTREEIENMFKLDRIIHKSVDEVYNNGDKIKLNYEQIISRSDYIKNKESTEKQVINYHKFVDDNKNNILTVQLCPDHSNMVTFEEDNRNENDKFLFWTGDLIRYEN